MSTKSRITQLVLYYTQVHLSIFLILLLNDDVLAETRVWEMNKLDRLVKFTGLKVKKKQFQGHNCKKHSLISCRQCHVTILFCHFELTQSTTTTTADTSDSKSVSGGHRDRVFFPAGGHWLVCRSSDPCFEFLHFRVYNQPKRF